MCVNWAKDSWERLQEAEVREQGSVIQEEKTPECGKLLTLTMHWGSISRLSYRCAHEEMAS